MSFAPGGCGSCWAWPLVYLVTTVTVAGTVRFLSSLQLPSTRKRIYIGGAKKWPRPRGHVPDPNVQVCGQLLHWCLPPLQRPDLPEPFRGLPAGEDNVCVPQSQKIVKNSENKLILTTTSSNYLLNHRFVKLYQNTPSHTIYCKYLVGYPVSINLCCSRSRSASKGKRTRKSDAI